VSLDALITELTRAAEREAEQLATDARARAWEIERNGMEEANRRRESELDRLAEAHRRAVARETADAERADRLALLEARARILDDVFARAGTLLAGAEAERYRRALPGLVAATLRYLEGAPAVLRCRPDAARAVRALCEGRPDVQVEEASDAEAGLLGEARDGRLVVDNRLSALLARRRAELSVAVARRLEDG